MLQNNITSVILFVLSVLVHGVHNVDYTDLEANGVNCPTRDKCDGYQNNMPYTERSCECDSACDTYNDCCIDVAERRSEGVRNGPRNGMRCMHYGKEDEHTGVYVVANCSNNWNGPIQLRRKCEGPIDFEDPVNVVPVVSMPGGVAYRNRYCAECNDANMENLVIFQLRLTCGALWIPEAEMLSNLTYNQTLRTWGINRLNYFGNATEFIGCKILFDVPGYLNSSVRFCRSNIISTCPPNYTRQEIRRACDEYMAIMYGYVYAYKNPHCAICNNVTVGQVACVNEALGKNRQTFALGLVLDLNRDHGDEVGKVIVSNPECPSGRIYDPFVKRCRRLGCALPGTVLVNGICVSG